MRRIKGSKDIDTNGDIADEIFSGAALRPPTHTPGEAFVVLNEIVVDRGPNASEFLCLFLPLFLSDPDSRG